MVLGIDLGSSSVKVMAVSQNQRYSAKASYPADIDPCVHPVNEVEAAVIRGIQTLFQTAPIRPEEIEAIGMCGHGPSIVFLDGEGAPLTPIITWQDSRALEESRMLGEKLPGFHKDGTSYEAKLCWFYTHHPELFVDGVQAFYPKDYFLYRLCGRRIMDSSTASTIAFYDRTGHHWEHCTPFFPPCVMPEVFPSWERAGETGTEFSRACGLPDHIPVVGGGIDSFCEAVGAGGVRDGIVVDGTGTSTCLTLCMKQDGIHSEHVLPGLALETPMLSWTGASYRWISRLFPETDMQALQETISPTKPINALYLPYLSGERSPINDDCATGVFVGLRPDTGKKELLHTVMQGGAFAVAQNLALMSCKVEKVRAVGGGNSSKLWLQMKANASGLCYEQMKENDAGAFGAALLAAYGIGRYTIEDLEQMLEISQVMQPETEYQAEYQALLRDYSGLYPKLKELYSSMYQLRGRLG